MKPQSFLGLDPKGYELSEQLCEDVHLLDSLLGQVLNAQEGPRLLELARTLYTEDASQNPTGLFDRIPELQDPQIVAKLLRAFTVLFQLMNTAEQKEIVRVNRVRQAASGGAPRPESIRDAVNQLKARGMEADEMQQLLHQIEICPTVTAHPTEARRRAVLDKLQTIARWLSEHAQPGDLPRLDTPLTASNMPELEIRRTLTALWQTDELRTGTITVTDEVKNAVYYFEHTILDAVPWLHEDMAKALSEAYPGKTFDIPAFIRFRSWVGGDRDGNPNVTADVTWQTLLYHKRIVLRYYAAQLQKLRRELTQSLKLTNVSEEMLQSIEKDKRTVLLGAARYRRYSQEPYVLKVLYIHSRLMATIKHLDALADFRAEGPGFKAASPAYNRSSELLDDLLLIQNSLRNNKAAELADGGLVGRLVSQVKTFGFHLATLDCRQHSDEHAKALDEVFAKSGILPQQAGYSSLSEADKVKLLSREILNPRPLLGRDWKGSDSLQHVLQVFEVIRHAQNYISPTSVQSYVISMTHGVSDILEALLLAKEFGLVRWIPEKDGMRLESDLDVVPLFETIDDLHVCDSLMRSLFANPAYRQHLKARKQFQEVMLGYSDSSKDGGYLAANWALHDTLGRMGKLGERSGVTLRLFHGRGGTVGRGGGRANQAILSMPPGSFNGKIRFTEQGEVVSFRYSLAPIAHRHFEQIANAVMLAARPATKTDKSEKLFGADLSKMAADSREVYRQLVYHNPDFWTFYTQATPIAHISRLPIASRPVFRPGKGLVGLHELRAIPWVFAWVQSRYVLPGWYGMGSAMDAFSQSEPGGLQKLQQMYADWPFFRNMIENAQLELLRANLPTAQWYAGRVPEKKVGERIHALIQQEYNKTLEIVLALTGQKELLENAPVVRRTVSLRNPAVAPLSKLQVALLNHWDALDDKPEGSSPWHDAILLSIAGIAAGMQSTG